MTSFTQAHLFMPIVSGPKAGHWRSGQTYRFYEHPDKTGDYIEVKAGDESNGADIPPAWAVFLGFALLARIFTDTHTACFIGLFMAALVAWLLPKIHAEYIAAIFIHDIGLKKFRHKLSRRKIDKLFLRALRDERWALTPMPSGGRALIIWGLCDVSLWVWRLIRPYLIFAGVSLWGILKERRNYFKPISLKGKDYV